MKSKLVSLAGGEARGRLVRPRRVKVMPGLSSRGFGDARGAIGPGTDMALDLGQVAVAPASTPSASEHVVALDHHRSGIAEDDENREFRVSRQPLEHDPLADRHIAAPLPFDEQEPAIDLDQPVDVGHRDPAREAFVQNGQIRLAEIPVAAVLVRATIPSHPASGHVFPPLLFPFN